MPATKAKKRPLTRLRCAECKSLNYFTKKSRKAAEEKLERKKFCMKCRKHNPHKEARK